MSKRYLELLRWIRILFKKSYYHLPQGLGKAFEPHQLNGYFNDMTRKIQWNGFKDKEGIPLIQLRDTSLHYFPTTIIQKALGHHDQYILTRDSKEWDECLKLCHWAIKTQDDNGGWQVSITGLKYSAMTQGEAISLLTRAWKLTDNDKYFLAAKKAYQLMILPIEEGGTSYYMNEELYLEEFPAREKNTILNGWIFAMFGVYDYFLITDDRDSKAIFYKTFNTLRNNISIFDSGFWSFYDEKKALASPFYHNLHISQLQALFSITKDKRIGYTIQKWKNYEQYLSNRILAIFFKCFQRLKHPSEA